MKRRQGPNVVTVSPGSPHHGVVARALMLCRWAGVELHVRWRRGVTGDVADDATCRAIALEAIRDRASALLGGGPDGFKPLYAPHDWMARELVRKLDMRFPAHQRLVAAVLAVDTGMAPAKALRVVQSGRWWLDPRWRRWTR